MSESKKRRPSNRRPSNRRPSKRTKRSDEFDPERHTGKHTVASRVADLVEGIRALGADALRFGSWCLHGFRTVKAKPKSRRRSHRKMPFYERFAVDFGWFVKGQWADAKRMGAKFMEITKGWWSDLLSKFRR